MPDQSLSFWLSWYFEPSIILGLTALVAAFQLATTRYRRLFSGSSPVSSAQRAAFFSGVAILAVALLSPLDRLGDSYWFTAHMVQHLLLTLVAPPLLLIGAPGWLYAPLHRYKRMMRVARFFVNPYVAFASFNLAFSIWHVPAWYQAALYDERIHILEHLSFLGTAVLTWMPVLSTTPLLPRLSPPAQVLYLFLQSLPPTILGALITFSSEPLYSFYTFAPRVWGLSVVDDQLCAGLVMWIGGALIWLLALSIAFFKWFGREDTVEEHGLI